MLYRNAKINDPADYRKFVRKHLFKSAKFIKNKGYVTPDNRYVPITLRKKI